MNESERVSVKLPNGSFVNIEVSDLGREDVGIQDFTFDDIAHVIEGIADSIQTSLSKIKPSKASVKFGIEASIESGKLTAAIIKGSSKANLEITLEWSNP
jgi:hypothetical protein